MSTWFQTYGYGEVHPGLIVGAYPLDPDDVDRLALLRVDRVLNLVEDSEYQPGDREAIEAAYAAHGIEETRMNLTDFGRLPADRLEQAVSELVDWLSDGQRVYVHCRAGWQRSAAVASGAVAVLRDTGIDEALRAVREQKPTADPLPHQRADLHEWWAARSAPAGG
ncbi:MAG TPA: dual specificity protein phosphatase family protein [Solirubrobacteraceae bacterium]|nr:dual specificity protein phosphatase family protein [Solirubrobacteraceae bacterium]